MVLMQTFVCVYVHASSIYVHYICAHMVYKWGSSLESTHPSRGMPLCDLFHQGVHPNEKLNKHIYNVLKLVESSVFICPLAILVMCAYNHGGLMYIVQIYNMFSGCHSVLLFMRSVSFSLTLLPDVTQEFKKPKIFCGATHDLIFSGHTVFAVLPLYIYSIITPSNTVVIVFMVVLNIINTICIVWFRRHYSVDVWLAHVLTFFVFHFISTCSYTKFLIDCL